MDNKEDQINNSDDKSLNNSKNISINEKEKNIYPFSERINFKYNFENNLEKDFTSNELLIAKNKNSQYQIFDYRSEALNLYEINENISAYYEKLETSSTASSHKKKQEGDYLENLLSYNLILNNESLRCFQNFSWKMDFLGST